MPVHIQCLHSPIVLHAKPLKFVILVKSGLSVSFVAFAVRRIHCQISSTINKICPFALNTLR